MKCDIIATIMSSSNFNVTWNKKKNRMGKEPAYLIDVVIVDYNCERRFSFTNR